ncbi:flavoprotein [Kineococcus sp. SYSU DK002]|uniref:flavoprotein n=1 Tax=Kineococcus sp. SYSU DK002 TaxID=3383123 RepID=UPI003D7C899E
MTLLVSASRPLRSLDHGLRLARERGAGLWVGASDSALSWLDQDAVEASIGRPLLNAGEPLPEERSTVCVAPATFNTVNKLASGISDTLVTAVAAEAIGAGNPVVVAPSMNTALLSHPVTAENRRRLTSYGVHLVWPRAGNEDSEDFSTWWQTVIDTSAVAGSSTS